VDLAFLGVAFTAAFLATFRSLGWGFLAVTAVGYFSGVIRANFLGMFTTFMFDGAVLGMYLASVIRSPGRAGRSGFGAAGPFVAFLMAWPSLLCLLPFNDYLVQCVALRAALWFLPVLLIATRLTTDDLAVLTGGLALLNLAALAVGVYVYMFGVEALFPVNQITKIIYDSNDLIEGKTRYHRVPSTFLSAHAYGGTMLLSLPFLIDRLAGVSVRKGERSLAIAGVVAAAGGLMMCGARLPLAILAFALLITCVLTRVSLKLVLVVGALIGVAILVASNSSRFQRIATLGDSDFVLRRIEGSANENFLELLKQYPLGAGMGSAVGTHIPYFLMDVAPEQVGMENEYSRILVDQGWFGLAGWLALLAWLYTRPPRFRPPAPWRLGAVFMYSLTLAIWSTAFLGVGLLTAVPGAFLLLTEMGILVSVRNDGVVPGALDDQTEDLTDFEAEADSDEDSVEEWELVPRHEYDPGRSAGYGQER
jgi:hypothetical protein